MKFKSVMYFMVAGLNLFGMMAGLWKLTDWDILEVMFGAVILTMISCSALYIGLNTAYIWLKQKRRKAYRIEQERRRKFQVYDLEGELVEIPGEDLTEIRNLVISKRNILLSGGTMQDVI